MHLPDPLAIIHLQEFASLWNFIRATSPFSTSLPLRLITENTQKKTVGFPCCQDSVAVHWFSRVHLLAWLAARSRCWRRDVAAVVVSITGNGSDVAAARTAVRRVAAVLRGRQPLGWITTISCMREMVGVCQYSPTTLTKRSPFFFLSLYCILRVQWMGGRECVQSSHRGVAELLPAITVGKKSC